MATSSLAVEARRSGTRGSSALEVKLREPLGAVNSARAQRRCNHLPTRAQSDSLSADKPW